MWVSKATGTPQTHQIKFPADSTQKHPRDIRRKEGTHDEMSTNRDKCGIVTTHVIPLVHHHDALCKIN